MAKLRGAEKEAFLKRMAAGRRKAAKGGAKAKPRKASAKPAKGPKRSKPKSAPKSAGLSGRVTRLETTVAKHGRAISDLGGVQEFMFREMQAGGFFGGGRQSRDTMVSPAPRRSGGASAFN